MSQVWELELSHAQQSIALAMADHGDDDGSRIFPSLARIAWKTGYSDRQVRRVVRQLEDLGLLVVVCASSRYRPVEYRMDAAAVARKHGFMSRADNFNPIDRGDTMTGLDDDREDTTVFGLADTSADIPDTRSDTAMSPRADISNTRTGNAVSSQGGHSGVCRTVSELSKDTLIQPPTKTTTTAQGANEPELGDAAHRRLEAFVNRRLEVGLGKAEWREEDLRKRAWVAGFQSLDASDHDFELALEAALRRRDKDWRRRLGGPRAAQAFVGEFPRLVPKSSSGSPGTDLGFFLREAS